MGIRKSYPVSGDCLIKLIFCLSITLQQSENIKNLKMSRYEDFVSRQIKAYAMFDASLEHDTNLVEEKKDSYADVRAAIEGLDGENDKERLTCLLALTTVESGTDKYADWITIPTQRPEVTTNYSTDALIQYFMHSNWINVKDPLRNFDNIDFMRKRVETFDALPIQVRQMIGEDLSMAGKIKICNEMVTAWKAGDIHKHEQLHVFIGLSSFISNGYLFRDKTVPQYQEMVRACPSGSFLIRESTQNIGDGRGHATVFTITYNKEYYCMNIRLISVHGVGVYAINYNIGIVHDISTMPCMKTLALGDILRDIKSIGADPAPGYHSVGEFLMELHRNETIDLTKILLPK